MRFPDSTIHTNQEMDETAVFLQAIENFRDKQTPLSEELDRFISYIAKTGDTLGPWEKVQKVFLNKLELTLDDFYKGAPYQSGMVNANAVNDDFTEMKKRLVQLAEEFESPPFTIQRLCELLSNPRKNYTRCEKFMRGLEKNLMVVSSWSNMPRTYEANERINGTVGTSNGYMSGAERYKPHWSNLPPSPVGTAPPKIPGAPDFTETQDPASTSSSEKTTNKGSTVEGENADVKAETETETEIKGESSDPQSQGQSDISPSTEVKDVPMESPSSKRKMSQEDESSSEKNNDSESEISGESPTKRIKQDEIDGKEESGERNAEIVENSNSDSAEIQNHDTAELQMKTGDSPQNAESAVGIHDDSAKAKTEEVHSQMESDTSSENSENANAKELNNEDCGNPSTEEISVGGSESDTSAKEESTAMETD